MRITYERGLNFSFSNGGYKMDLIFLTRIIGGILLILIGAGLTYNSWNRFTNNPKTAERLAPVILNAALFVLGIIILFFTFQWWILAVAAVLLILGVLMRGPNKTTYIR
jgi:uncharacterized membrane protein YidH (DUF202 family)